MNPCCESLCRCASLWVASQEEKHFHPVTSVTLTRSGVKLVSVFTPDWTDPVMGHYTSCVIRISWCYVWEINTAFRLNHWWDNSNSLNLAPIRYNNTDNCLLGFSSLACSLKDKQLGNKIGENVQSCWVIFLFKKNIINKYKYKTFFFWTELFWF